MIRENNNKGFTLLELLVSISIMSIILLAFLTITISSIKGNTKNDKDISALNLAQSEIEILRKQIKDGKTDFNDEPYIKEIDGKKFEVKLSVSESKEDTSSQYTLYEVYVSVEAKQENKENDYFSKKHTELVTEVLGYNTGN